MRILLPWLKKLAVFILVLLVIYAIGRPTQLLSGSYYFGVREPYLQMMSTNSVTLRWQSEHASIGVVRYGEQVKQLHFIAKENTADEEHEIRLMKLKPATKYFYSAGDNESENFKGHDFWFKTAPIKKDSAVRFWVTGDQGYANPIQDEVRDAMLAWVTENPRSGTNSSPLDFWITTGDNAYRSGSNKQFQKGFFEPYKMILRNTPVWPAYGNHDARRWAFFNIFTFPTKAESGGVASGSEHYYSFDYANLHIVMLDTEDSEHDVDGEMLSWLKKDLQATKQQWLLVAFHHPPYTKGSHDSDNKRDSRGRMVSVRENIIPLLEQYGVDVVLSGHSHMYERSELIACHYGESSSFKINMIRQKGRYFKKGKGISQNSGTIYVVMGSSSKVDDGPLDHPALPYSLKEAGSMIFDVNKNSLKAYFINKSGIVKDQFEMVKAVNTGVKSSKCK